MTALDTFLALLDEAIQRAGNMNRLAVITQVHTNLITRWKKGERTPTLTSIQPVLDFLEKEMCFRDTSSGAEVVPATPKEARRIAELERQIAELKEALAEVRGENRVLSKIVDRLAPPASAQASPTAKEPVKKTG